MHPTPWWDWADIVDLDYCHPELRRYMTDAMKYWVTETDIDGFRCDVAGFVPVDFWNNVRAELDAIKPVFMLAEWEARDLHADAFDMTYAWSWQQTMHEIATGKADLESLYVYYAWNQKAYPADAIRMMFVSNHDINSTDGPDRERFGDALEAAIALSVVGGGMPLLHNGQEAGEQRLEFFERDPIQWREHPVGELYRRLFALKRQNTALANGSAGAPMVQVPNSRPRSLFSFLRANDDDAVFAVFNLSADRVTAEFVDDTAYGTYTDFEDGREVAVDASFAPELGPWEHRILLRSRGTPG